MPFDLGSSSGVIFNIQRFSIHDGPGIRTTVFTKGCPLRCDWCSNPESQSSAPILMVRDAVCGRCGRCAEVCPERAIALDPEEGRRIDWGRCTQCHRCVPACVYGSLGVSGRLVSVAEVVEEVERDRDFYANSGGGVTISGGEPLQQRVFVQALLGAFKERDLHTALDTSGQADPAAWKDILPWVDLVLFDIKHLDSEAHRRHTGVGNEVILRSAREVTRAVRTWFRVPLIAGFNDAPEHIEAVGRLARELGAEKVSLLPYHLGGEAKSSQIGRPYPFPEGRTPDTDHVQRLAAVIAGTGVAAGIGL